MSDKLPKGWALCRTGTVFSSSSGGTPNRATAYYWGGSIPWLSSGDIKSHRVVAASEQITEVGLENSSARLCRRGSVLVVVRSGILKHSLPVGILECEAAINQDIKCFDSGDNTLNAWLALSLRAASKELLGLRRDGTTVQSIKSETLKEFTFPLPPKSEQQRIMAKVNGLLARVSTCQTRLAKIPLLLKRFRQSVLAAACSGRLTTDWREKTDSSEWNDTTLRAVLREMRTGPFGSALHKSDYLTGGIPIINPVNIISGTIVPSEDTAVSPETFTRLCDYALKEGDIIIARRGEMGRCAVVTKKQVGWLCGTGSAILRLTESVSSVFIQMLISSPQVRAYLGEASVGTTMANLNQKMFKVMPVSLPPVAEQREIVRRVEELFAVADQIEAGYAKAKTHVDKLTQSILAKAFRGELVPQDPNDEPADKLLARIRQQRAQTTISPRSRRKASL